MARAPRRGRFGRLPRSQPSITNTLIAIAREMANQRDRNIMDAWQKGGTFEGRPVTDEMVLSHWRERMSKVDKKDPLFETYKNAVAQYEYAIAESKATTEYAQGKRSDAAMAKFYLDWSKKVPKNSEFYRVLQRDAAQFMRAARAKGAAAAKKAAEEAYRQAQESDYNRYEKAGEYMTDVIRQLARANALIGADFGTDITQFDTSDPAKMLALLETINGTARLFGEPASRVLFRDQLTGKNVTSASILADLKRLDPSFDGRVSLGYFKGLLQRQLQGQSIRLKRAETTGHATDVNNLRKWQQYTAEIGREANLWPVQESYNQARNTFLATWMSPTATPDTKMQAWKEYSATLTKLAGTKDLDDNTRSRIIAEVEGDGSVKSLAEDFTGLNSSDNTTTTGGFKGDIAETALDVERYTVMQEAVLSNLAVWTTGQTNDDGVFVPKPGGQEIGAATLQDIQAASPVQPVVIFVPQGGGAKSIPVVVSGVNVTTSATDEKGQVVKTTDANPVGAAYDVTVGGFKSRVYSYQGADGRTYYTADSPWDDNAVRARETPQGIVLDLSAYVPRQNEQGEWVLANGQPYDVGGTGAFALSEPNQQNKQTLVMNPTKATYLSDPARAMAGPDPLTDSFSPTLAALMSTSEGQRVLNTLKDDPAFRQQLEFEAYRAAGFIQDPTSGQWLGGDQAAFAKFNGQLVELQNRNPGDFAFHQGAADRFERQTTNGTFMATVPNRAAMADLSNFAGKSKDDLASLPADQVRGTSFGALSDVFETGTNIFRPVSQGASAALQLQLQGTIKVPEVAKPSVAPTPTPAPIATPTPTTTPVNPVVPPAPVTKPPPGAQPVQPVPGSGLIYTGIPY